MPSPFPGMDPHLEDPAFWKGFHTTFLVYLRKGLRARLPEGYYADVEQHIWLEGDELEDRVAFAYPCAFISTTDKPRSVRGTSALLNATAATAELTFSKPIKKKSTKYVKIIDSRDKRVVTVVELLSPSNKSSGSDRRGYLAKREEYILSGTNLVEIDLLRDGARLPMGRSRLPIADYYVLVSRTQNFPLVDLWAFTLRDELPNIPIPLKPEHDDVPDSLRDCLDDAYEDADYETRIDYALRPDSPLRSPDAARATKLLKTTTR